jgi:hypothetical protein
MTAELHRKVAAMIAEELKPRVGMVVVVIANESPERDGGLEIDAAMRTGVARTEEGGLRLVQLGQELGDAVERVARELAEEWHSDAVDHPMEGAS